MAAARSKRDTTWKRDGKTRGVYFRLRVDGSKSWGYYAYGRIHAAQTRQDAIDQKAKAVLRRSAGLPAPDTRVRIRDLAEEVREARRQRLRASSFAALEHALDKVLLPELGHLKPGQAGPDRIAQLIRDLEARGLAAATIRRYLSPLSAIFRLAVRRGIIPSSPLALLSDDERPSQAHAREHFVWSPETISMLIAAADQLGQRPTAQYNYAPLIRVLALTGLRVSEALALRWENIDLLDGIIRVRHSLTREGSLAQPKTAAGVRNVPLAPGLVDLFAELRHPEAEDHEFVFASRAGGKPISYWNFRRRGFQQAVELAGLTDCSVTVHDLRHAAVSLYIASGLTAVEVAHVMGHADSSLTLRVYSHLFDRSGVEERVRAAQSLLES